MTEALCNVTTCANDVIIAEKPYACLKIVNNKTKMNKPCVSSHRCLGSLVVRKEEFRLKGFISLEEINLSRQKQQYGFYLFDKSWYLSAKHIYIYLYGCYQFVYTEYELKVNFKLFLASGNFCHLLITFANSLDPDQDQHVGSDLDPNCLTCQSWSVLTWIQTV